METKNLLAETIEELAYYGKTLDDIVWVGSKDGYMPIEKFVELADVEYDSGFGLQKVATDLTIVGKDFYMIRGEYDGSEWWAYSSMDLFVKPKREMDVESLISASYEETLSKINDGLCGKI